MNLDVLRLLVDFGLVVFVWIIQIIIYPSFRSIDKERFVQWHRSYTRKVSYFAAPLMIAQAVLFLFSAWSSPSIFLMPAGILIVSMWWITFRFAVPLHEKLSNGSDIEEHSIQLITVNWWRTAGWSSILVLTIIGIYLA